MLVAQVKPKTLDRCFSWFERARWMYSPEWFSTFSATIPRAAIDREVEALVRLFPVAKYRRLLDVGCGIGRVAGPLASRGYVVTGIDVNLTALHEAHRVAPGPAYVALDQRHVGLPSWRFDAAFVLWNSIGFVSRDVDEITLGGLHRVIRPSGLLALDMYHPAWLVQNAARRSPPQPDETVTARRWLQDGRLHNRIEYPSGRADQIDFHVYTPEELLAAMERLGFELDCSMVWWDPSIAPSEEHARYQMLFRRSREP